MNKTYIVCLTDDERQELLQLTRSGKAAAYKIKHAHILLQVDANGPNWSDAHVATALHCHGNTIRNVRQRFVEQGLAAALVRKKQGKPSRPCLLDGAKEARLMALRCGPPPPGQAKWTLQLLADQLVELNVVETISYETVRQTIKKTSSSHTCKNVGGFPRSTMQTLLPTWKMSWISINAPMIHGTRLSTWMKSLCS
jgi:transposase